MCTKHLCTYMCNEIILTSSLSSRKWREYLDKCAFLSFLTYNTVAWHTTVPKAGEPGVKPART